jgi:RNA polymerase sigma-70 factor (ECF subfamily)
MLDQSRGERRFTTRAYKFVILEVSGKLGPHFWLNPGAPMDPSAPMEAEDGTGCRTDSGSTPPPRQESRELIAALRPAVEDELTERQRRVFAAIVLDGVPLDVMVRELGPSRNASTK